MNRPLTERVARPASRLRRNLNYWHWEGILRIPTNFLAMPGNLVVTLLLKQYYHLSIMQFGIIVSLPAACNALQVVVMPWLNDRYSSKQMNILTTRVHWAACLGMVAMLVLVPNDGSPWIFPLLLALFAVFSASWTFFVISWTSLTHEFTPERIRGKYFGRRNAVLQIFFVFFLIAAAPWLEWSQQGHIISLRDGLISLICFSMLLRVGSMRLQHLTSSSSDLLKSAHKSAPAAANEPSRAWTVQLKQIFAQRNLKAYFIFGAGFGFASSLMGSFFGVFQLDVLGMSAMQIMASIVLASITGALSMIEWGRMIDRYGNRPVLAFCLAIWMVIGYGWAFVTADRLWLIYVMSAMGGIFMAGFGQSIFGLLLKIIPPENKTLAISINTTVTAVPAAIAPVIGAALLETCMNAGWSKLTVYQSATAIHHTLTLLTVILLLRVHEPKAQPLSHLMGAMRSYRQIVSILGLSFFADYIFFRKK